MDTQSSSRRALKPVQEQEPSSGGKKSFWRMVDISILNSWIIFRSIFPGKITSHRLFRIQLVHELVQPLLSLKASPDCPATLSYKGLRPTNTEKRLLGKHFPSL